MSSRKSWGQGTSGDQNKTKLLLYVLLANVNPHSFWQRFQFWEAEMKVLLQQHLESFTHQSEKPRVLQLVPSSKALPSNMIDIVQSLATETAHSLMSSNNLPSHWIEEKESMQVREVLIIYTTFFLVKINILLFWNDTLKILELLPIFPTKFFSVCSTCVSGLPMFHE